jgi:hypothetical protein
MEKTEKTTPREWAEIFSVLDKVGIPDDFLVDRGQKPPQERTWGPNDRISE